MTQKHSIVVAGLIACLAAGGCRGRVVSEGIGLVRGASGKVSEIQAPPDLTKYRGIRIEPITIAPDLDVPAQVPTLLSEAYSEKAAELRLTADGEPALVVSGEVIHFEKDEVVDKAIGPLQEIIVRTRLRDAESGKPLGQANLVGRAKAVTASGTEHLCEGAGRALKKWLKKHGVKESDEEKEENEH